MFKTLEVTNPAIDPYRESLVMSIEVYLGRQGNLMAESPTYFQNKANNRLVKARPPRTRMYSIDFNSFPLPWPCPDRLAFPERATAVCHLLSVF